MRRHHHQRLAQIHCLADGLETGGRRVCTATCHLAQELLVIQIIEAERVIHDLDRGLGSIVPEKAQRHGRVGLMP